MARVLPWETTFFNQILSWQLAGIQQLPCEMDIFSFLLYFIYSCFISFKSTHIKLHKLQQQQHQTNKSYIFFENVKNTYSMVLQINEKKKMFLRKYVYWPSWLQHQQINLVNACAGQKHKKLTNFLMQTSHHSCKIVTKPLSSV